MRTWLKALHPGMLLVVVFAALILPAGVIAWATTPKPSAYSACAMPQAERIVDSVSEVMRQEQTARIAHPGSTNIEWLVGAQATEREKLDSTAALLYKAADALDRSAIGCNVRDH